MGLKLHLGKYVYICSCSSYLGTDRNINAMEWMTKVVQLVEVRSSL